VTRPKAPRRSPEWDAAVTRAYQLGLAADDGELVTIEDVTIDLSSREIDRKLWMTRDGFGYEWPQALGPRLAFPWTSKRYRKALADAGDFVEVASGDTIIVSHVERKRFKGSLGHWELEADQEALGAHLAVGRSNGEFEFVPFPLAFVRRGATMPPLRPILGEFGALKRSLIKHLQDLTGIPDIEGALDHVEDEGWEALPKIRSSANHDSRWALFALSRAGRDEDAFVAFGYHMARALLVERPVERLTLGGRLSGEARQSTARTRNDYAFSLARHLLETEPELRENFVNLARRVKAEALSRGASTPKEKLTITDEWLAQLLKGELAKPD
jgi:hypothetical protein